MNVYQAAGSSLKKVNLGHNKITVVPKELFEICPSIESFLINNNQLTSIPQSLSMLTKLTELNLASNQIDNSFGIDLDSGIQLSQVFPRSLKVLNLSNNKLTKIPNFVYKMPLLETLELQQNKIDSWQEDAEDIDFS